MTELADITSMRKASVTNDGRQTALAVYFLPFWGARPLITLPIDPPDYWMPARDIILRQTIRAESMWGDAVGIAITKMANAGYKIEGPQRRVNQAHDLLKGVEFGKGWRNFIGLVGRDFLTCDNGAFVEIIRASKGPGSQVVGLAHLDSLRCRRTGDDETPVIYQGLDGRDHELQWHQVFSIVDMPDPSESMRGVGFCAASRAYNTIFKLAAIERYVAEKASGRRPLEVVFVNGVSDKQLQGALASASSEADAKGYRTYMGAAVIPTNSDQKVESVTIPLASVPDFVDIEKEREDAYLRYADSLGLDIQEIKPLTHGGSNTATQSVVLDEKERGKFGWFELFQEQIALHKIVGGSCTFAFSHKDWRDQQLEAAVRLQRAQARQVQVNTGEITAQESRQIAAQVNDIPQEFLQQDLTTQSTIYDEDNPDQQDAVAPEQLPTTPTTPTAPQSPNSPPPPGPSRSPIPGAGRPGGTQFVQTRPIPTAKESESELESGSLTFRASGVELGSVVPERVGDLYYSESTAPETFQAYLDKVESELSDYGRLLVGIAKDECPSKSGELRDSIRWAVEGKGTRDISLHVYAGNSERPEVVVRSVLYGRRGFGPKDPEGALAFEVNGKEVFTKHVGPAAANDWWGRAWDGTAAERNAMARRIGKLGKDLIAVSDVKRPNDAHIDNYRPGKSDQTARVIKESDGTTVRAFDPEQPRSGNGRWRHNGLYVRRRYTEVNAVQWTGPDHKLEGVQRLGNSDIFAIHTMGGWVRVAPNDWIVSSADGSKLVVNPDDFSKSFKPA